jgi:hypothetical protein
MSNFESCWVSGIGICDFGGLGGLLTLREAGSELATGARGWDVERLWYSSTCTRWVGGSRAVR